MKLEIKSMVEIDRALLNPKVMPKGVLKATDILYTPEMHQEYLEKQSGVNE